MKKALALLSVLGILSLTSCKNEDKEQGYVINGIAKNIADSTQISISADNAVLDSTIVLNEKFQFTGKVDAPINVFLEVKNSRDYKSFWLENNTIEFTAEKGAFRNSIIKGSKTQIEDDLLSSRREPFRKEMDSLRKIMFRKDVTKTKQDSLIPILDALRKNEDIENQKFIKEFPNSLVSTRLLSILKTTWGKELSTELFSLMNTERQESKDGKSIARYLALNKNLQIGDTYVDFEQENSKGEKIKLSDIKGKYTLLEFWSSWCGPCRQSNPKLVKAYKKYHEKGFEILGVSLDQDKASWVKAIEKDSLIWENVSDLKGFENEAGLIYGVNGIPDNFLLDQNGVIIGRRLRGKKFTDKLEELFNEDSSL